MAAELQNKRPNPYVGPRSFQTGDKIYGRDWETEELRDLVIAKRIVMLHSPSGAGKTSLIHAALIPALRAENFRILPPIRVGMDPPPAVLKAGCTFNRYVLSAIISLGGTRLDQTDLFKLCSVTLPEYLNYLSSEFERAADPHRLPDELLIFDQFEEILTVDPLDREAKEVFFAQMGEVLRDTPRWALIAIREDYVGSLEPYLHHIPTRLTAHFRLEKLDKQAAYSALEEPVLERGVTYAEGVAERLIEQLVTLPQGKSEFVEPVQLQVVAHALWEYWQQHASEDGTITGEHLAAFGDVEQALSNFYDACIRDTVQKTGVPEHELRRWFDEKMITPAGTRGIVYKGERETEGIPNTAVNVLDHLHIIRVEPRAGADWCEIAHDGFISAIRESNRAFEERLFEQRSRQLLRLAGAGLIALVIAALIGVFVINQRANNARQREKDRAAVAAAQAKELAAAAKVDSLVAGSRLAFNKGDTPAAIALAQEAIKESWKLGLENQNDLYSLLVKVAYAPGPRQQFGEPGGSYFGGQVAVSPGGTTVLYTLGVDGSKVASALIALDLASGEERRFEQSSQVRDIVFLDEGRALVGYERVLEIFDLATGAAQPLTALPANEFLYSFAVGPGGTKAAAAVCRDVSLDGTLCKQGSLLVLDLESDQILRSLGNNTLTISSVAYSPNDATVLSGECVGANDDPTVKSEPCPQGILTLWDIKTGVPVQLPVGPGAITNIAVSPNGTRALVSVDQTLQYWNLESGDLLDVLQAHTSRVNAVTISRDGLHALSAGDSIIWWDLTTRQPLERLTPGDTEIWDVAFGANDQTALSVQYDGTLVWWDLLPGSQLKQFQGPGGPTLPLTVAASVDAQTVVYGAGNLPLLVWDAASQQVMQVFPQSEDPMEHVALSANGRMLTRTSGGVITLWDATTASELVSLIRSGSVSSLALNASGDLGIVGFSTGILGTLDFTNESVPSQTFAAEDRNSRVTALAIYESPGDVEQSVQVATGWCITQACDQSRVSRRVLDGESWQLGTYNGEVTSLAFSVDGQILAVGLSSGSVVLLDIAAGTELHRFEAHTDPVISLSFREDNRALLSGSSKNVWIMWRFDDTLENLHEWASQRRYVPVLSCVLRHVYDVECPVPITVGALPTGSPVTGSLVANDSQSWVFDGAKDRPVTIQVMDAYARNGLAEDTILILFGPDGTELAFQRLDTITETKLILTVDLPETGQYKAAIYTGDTGLEYTLQLTDLTLTTPTPLPTARARSSLTPTPDEQLSFTPTLLISPTSTLSPTPLPSRPIMWGQTVTGTLDVGQQENWSFQANAQDTISIMLYWDTPNWEPSLTLYTADNRIVDLRYGDSQAQQVGMERVRLPDTGTYIVSVKNKVEVTGSYRLVLTNLVLTTATPDPSIAMQQQQQPLSQAAQQQVYQQQVVVMPPLALELPPVTLTPLAPAVWAAAQVGPNAGAIPVGDRAVWTYTGCAGERLALSVMAAYPINSTALADIQPGMLDPAVVLYGPDGAVLAQADDIDFLVNTDARIEFVTLPAAGVYEIEVSGSSLQTGGAYTLTIESDRSACSG